MPYFFVHIKMTYTEKYYKNLDVYTGIKIYIIVFNIFTASKGLY